MNPLTVFVPLVIFLCLFDSVLTTELNCLEKIPFPLYDSVVKNWEKKHFEPDALRTVPELIRSRGWTAEEHFVTTTDGYILGVHRIVNPTGTGNAGRKAVLFGHGLLSSSADFVMNAVGGDFDPAENFTTLRAAFLQDYDPATRTYNPTQGKTRGVGKNLAFETTRMGFDVWLLNLRGNIYSTNHTHLNPCRDESYWNFGLDQESQIDLPTIIDYVCKVNGQCVGFGLGYVGYSQGTEIMFMRMSRNAATQTLIRPFVALAPIGRTTHATAMNVIGPITDKIIGKFGPFPFFPSSKAISFLLDAACGSKYNEKLCNYLLEKISGFDLQELNQTRTEVYYKHIPAGTSSRNLIHWAQIYDQHGPHEFDYGFFQNLQRYQSFRPPPYDLSQINPEKIALFHSANDGSADLRDVDWLKNQLTQFGRDGRKLLDYYLVPNKKFNHLDFILAQDTNKLVNPQTIYLLLKN